MQDQGIEPPLNTAAEPPQDMIEARLLALLLDEYSEQVWMREELAREFPDAPLAFQEVIDRLACADVIHTYGPFVLLSRAVKRAVQAIKGVPRSIH